MHKSKGNAIEPFTVLERYGADPIRWYMLYTSPVWTPLRFDEEGVKKGSLEFKPGHFLVQRLIDGDY